MVERIFETKLPKRYFPVTWMGYFRKMSKETFISIPESMFLLEYLNPKGNLTQIISDNGL